jgi:TonB family protein
LSGFTVLSLIVRHNDNFVPITLVTEWLAELTALQRISGAKNMRTFVFAAFLMANVAFATEPERIETGSVMHSRLAAATAARTRDDVHRVVDNNKGKVYALYAGALRDKPGLQGTVVLAISIAPNGQVTKCSVASSTLNDAAFEKRVVERFSSINFGAKGTQTYNEQYPLSFFGSSGAHK